jgi:hypothetical protein
VSPSLVLLGLVARLGGADRPGAWLIRTGCACFLLGCVWMFYLKPRLKRREARP